MRVLLVSAHFPPNFVSGGTLVPFRSALELARRGHHVKVFAGWIGPTRRPAEAFDDVAGPEDSPVPVRWFTTNGAIEWGNRLNFDNPAATADFAGTLRAFEPDVVHFHSMQGIGAGPLTEADRCGVPFVVTAHDFWWWCGRQFLCDRDYHPCCPVVVAGVCPCAVDRAWLDERTASTTAALGLAARVVAVSESSARVLQANGVPSGKLAVLPNPVERAPVSVTPPRAAGGAGDGVRFVFAGGRDPMKGLPVLEQALRSLGSVGGWTADLYGVDTRPAPASPSPSASAASADSAFPPNVRAHAAFAPETLPAVLAAADVLVVPSVMQETYSILTREALAAGVPVVTTACLGPEEVVTDGENGLVVPQDDPDALAAAMGALVRDPTLRERLARAASAVELTTLEAHCDRLEQLYTEALRHGCPPGSEPARGSTGAAPPSGEDETRAVRRVLFVVGIDGAPLRYRAHLPAEALRLLGVHADVLHYRHPAIVELAKPADVVVLYRVPATHQIRRFVEDVRARGTPVLFDVDDLIFDPSLEEEIPALQILTGADRELWMQGVRRYRTTMELCDAFVGSTGLLCDHASAVTGLPAFRFPNGAGIAMGRLADAAIRRARPPGPVRVGYLSGTDTHDRDWAMIEDVVVTALDAVPDSELWLVGKLTPGGAVERLGGRLRRLPFQPWTELPALLRALDVNLAPLEGGRRFNEAKSAIKWLEAGLSGTPTIATPTQPFREVVEHGVNGMLAEDEADWAHALTTLLGDGALRRRLGRRARRDALFGFGPWTQGSRYLEILRSVEPRPPHPTTWRPVLLDEPFEPVTLEPYDDHPPVRPPSPHAPPHAPPRSDAASLVRRGLASVRRRGVLKTALLALGRARRRAGRP